MGLSDDQVALESERDCPAFAIFGLLSWALGFLRDRKNKINRPRISFDTISGSICVDARLVPQCRSSACRRVACGIPPMRREKFASELALCAFRASTEAANTHAM